MYAVPLCNNQSIWKYFDDKSITENKTYEIETIRFCRPFWWSNFKKNIMLNNEKKSTKLWGLISEDCQIKNKFNDTKIVATNEFCKSVKIFVK